MAVDHQPYSLCVLVDRIPIVSNASRPFKRQRRNEETLRLIQIFPWSSSPPAPQPNRILRLRLDRLLLTAAETHHLVCLFASELRALSRLPAALLGLGSLLAAFVLGVFCGALLPGLPFCLSGVGLSSLKFCAYCFMRARSLPSVVSAEE